MAVMRDEDRKTNEVLSILRIIQREQKHAQVKLLIELETNIVNLNCTCKYGITVHISVTKICPYNLFFIKTLLNYDFSLKNLIKRIVFYSLILLIPSQNLVLCIIVIFLWPASRTPWNHQFGRQFSMQKLVIDTGERPNVSNTISGNHQNNLKMRRNQSSSIRTGDLWWKKNRTS